MMSKTYSCPELFHLGGIQQSLNEFRGSGNEGDLFTSNQTLMSSYATARMVRNNVRQGVA